MDSKLGWALVLIGGFTLGAFALACFVSNTQSVPSSPYRDSKVTLTPIYGRKPIIHNEETWEWTDWKGRERKIVIKRKVTES